MHPAAHQKLQAFARTVDWAVPHPLHRRKFQKFILEAFKQGDRHLSPAEIEQAVVECCGMRPIHLDEWIREYRRGIELLEMDHCK